MHFVSPFGVSKKTDGAFVQNISSFNRKFDDPSSALEIGEEVT